MKKITYILLSACFLLTSCEDFLNRDPDAKVGSGDYFTDEGSLLTYINGFIQKYTPSAADLGYGDGYSDIMATEKSFTFLTNASWTPDLQSGWSISNWTPIYNINYFLVHMREAKGLSEATYNHYEGTARFWRAWQYFEKVKTFGAVPWYDEPIDPEDMVALYKPRDSREYVMERVLEDLNFACEHCYTSSDWINCARINRYIALAYKARVCLFEGTYRKYHSVAPSTGKAWEDKQASAKFLRECAEACEELMAAGVYSIVNNPAKVKTQYRELFTQEAVNTTEVIWARQMSVGMTTFHDLTWRYTSSSYGQRWSLDQDFVKTYLNLDGSRHTATGEEFTTEVENRDYGLSDSDLLEIRRERAIELLLEGFRYDDLMRWHAGELLNKQWYGIYIPAMDTSYDLNGDGINDVCVTSGEAGNEPGVTYIILDNSKYSLENGTTGRLLYTVGRNFEEKRYLRPIPKTALNINPDLGQNYYWR